LALNADSTTAHRILANRSLAYLRAKCLDEALADGLAAAAAAPMWDKAHWRAGAALLALRRIPEAVASFLSCWQCSAGALILVSIDFIIITAMITCHTLMWDTMLINKKATCFASPCRSCV